MIHSFACQDTEALFKRRPVTRFKNIERVARRKLNMLQASSILQDLKVPPGNKLELLKGQRKNWYSIRINDQWRLCFVWLDKGAHEVKIIDYH